MEKVKIEDRNVAMAFFGRLEGWGRGGIEYGVHLRECSPFYMY